MADRHLPSVPAPTPGSETRAPAVERARRPGTGATGDAGGTGGSGAGRGPGPREGAPGRPPRTAAAARVVLLAGGLILALGLASLLGDPVRSAVLVAVDRNPAGSEPSYSDAPAEAISFFARRDTVRVRVPRDMTVADFLSLYHLETNGAARAALRDQLGAVTDGDVLREGDQVTLTVTVPGVER